MSGYPHVLARILDAPLLAHPAKAAVVAGAVLRRAGLELDLSGVGAAGLGPLQERRLRQPFTERGLKPFLFDAETGIAAIEVTGTLAHRQWHVGESSGIMGYDGIAAQFEAALADRDVRAILFDIHSPGGEVAGAFALADRVFEARRGKPLVAVADEMAFSAAYLIAAAAGEVILASESAAVGSVGVVLLHVSFERQLANEGVKPTLIKAGARKTDGNPFEDLAPEVVERFQAEVDAVYDLFVARVAAWRGLAEDAVRATEGGTFMGLSAVAAGLADGIADPSRIFRALAAAAAERAALI